MAVLLCITKKSQIYVFDGRTEIVVYFLVFSIFGSAKRYLAIAKRRCVGLSRMMLD